MIFAFVVLHYMVENDTIECVKSILNNVTVKKNDKLYIIIVDNGSLNASFCSICYEFQNVNNVILIHNDYNLGFAKGNNVGFKLAKNKLKADFIILINNDTVISQSDLLSVMQSLYNKYNYAALGPDIITADSNHQNPFNSAKWTIQSLHKARIKQRIKYFLTWICVDTLLIKNKASYNKQTFVNHDEINADLHGACLIFSRKYIDRFDGLCDKTFLYMEEEILKLYLEHENLISLYSPKISIYHKEDMATKAVAKSSRERKLAKYRHWIESSFVYEDVYKKLNYKDN